MLVFPLHRKNDEEAQLRVLQLIPDFPILLSPESFPYLDLSGTVKPARCPLKALPTVRLWTLAWRQQSIPNSSPQG